MGRTVRDTNLETRTARLRLATRGKPYWRVIESGLHLGYRRRARGGGTWTARRFIGAGRYAETALGIADDLQEADGVAVLSFRHAQDAVRRWWKDAERRALDHEDAHDGPYTVADALREYQQHYEKKGGRDRKNLHSIVSSHILPALGDVEACRLTTRKLREWHQQIAESPKMVRTGKGAAERNTSPHDPGDNEAVRRRRSRANRILTVLKAALNHAFNERRVPSDDAWRRVTPYRDVDRPSVHYLSAAECLRLVNACDNDFRPLVRAALLTGARYSELARLKERDVDPEAGTIHIREAKSGKPRHVPLTEEGVELFSLLMMSRVSSDLLFVRSDGSGWRPSQQARPLAAACERAKIAPAITFHGLRDTYASMLAMKGVERQAC